MEVLIMFELMPYATRRNIMNPFTFFDNDFWGTAGEIKTDITDTGDAFKLEADLPGFKKDEIIMTATSPGGSTLFGTKDIDNLKVFNDVIEIGGLGNFSATDLSKRLAGKKVSCALSLSQDS